MPLPLYCESEPLPVRGRFNIGYEVFGDHLAGFGGSYSYRYVPREVFPKALDIGNSLCAFTNELDEPTDVLIDDGLGTILDEDPSPVYRFDGIDEHPLSADIPVFLGFLGDIIPIVDDQLLFGGILFTIRVGRVEARPNSM